MGMTAEMMDKPPANPDQKLWAIIDDKRIDDCIDLLKLLCQLYPSAAKFCPKEKEAKIWSLIDFGKNIYIRAFEEIFKV